MAFPIFFSSRPWPRRRGVGGALDEDCVRWWSGGYLREGSAHRGRGPWGSCRRRAPWRPGGPSSSSRCVACCFFFCDGFPLYIVRNSRTCSDWPSERKIKIILYMYTP